MSGDSKEAPTGIKDPPLASAPFSTLSTNNEHCNLASVSLRAVRGNAAAEQYPHYANPIPRAQSQSQNDTRAHTMSIETPTPIRSPSVSRSSSFAREPRKPSPLRRSSTPAENTEAPRLTQRRDEDDVGEEEREAGEEEHAQTRRTSDGHAILPSSSLSSSSKPTMTQFSNTSLSKSTSHLSEMTYDADAAPRIKPIGSNTRYTLPPIRATPKFPHSTSLRPLRPLSSVTGGTALPQRTLGGPGSLTSVPHAGVGTSRAPQRQKIIVPSKSWKACFDLNLTQKELARFD